MLTIYKTQVTPPEDTEIAFVSYGLSGSRIKDVIAGIWTPKLFNVVLALSMGDRR
jgi:hypothetical protein